MEDVENINSIAPKMKNYRKNINMNMNMQQQQPFQQNLMTPSYNNDISNEVVNGYNYLDHGSDMSTNNHSYMIPNGRQKHHRYSEQQQQQHYVKGRSTSLRVQKNNNNNASRSYNIDNIAESLNNEQQNIDTSVRRSTSLDLSNLHRNNKNYSNPNRSPRVHNLQYHIMPFPLRKYLADMAKCKIFELIQCASVSVEKILDQEYWNAAISKWFTPAATMNVSKNTHNTHRHFIYLAKMFSVLCQADRYLDIDRFELYPSQVFTQVLSNGTIFFSCLRLSFIYYYKDGSCVTHYSQFKGVFNTNFKIEWMDFGVHSFVPGIEWNVLEKTISNIQPTQNATNEATPNDPYDSQFRTSTNSSSYDGNDDNTNMNTDPEKSQDEMKQKFTAITKLRSNFEMFRNISALGVHCDIVRALQTNEIMSDLRFVRIFQRMHNIDSPLAALQAFVDEKAQDIKAYKAAVNQNMGRVRSQTHASNTNSGMSYVPANNMGMNNPEI
ncbi:similar to Saccharomyces cerevisiae YDL233W Putative protein of unknown function [Maudiozyma barnettii]|uniref:Uncharacterized protein n=1 Tax=Maudiozyma barnettii TaxID=61262 RepID=A0A8H2VEW3_9SACH|nr:uncharacterized protein KABA2_03S07040 [Kazachstania barnettii]CAB4253859.1 similar to Saccharomyces cerevisiae YDL233W Putative protein of unknown function [Kazachstania barnettii]CAD1781609.1 similar to Saccharomyces cerevisiae YDL233W Putative protein of unknown function [Kazachstania barnettii]